MAGSVNKVILVGNVGKDPEVRTNQNGGRFVNMSLATSESWKDKATGERKENTQWHRVVIFNDALAGVAEKYVRKGTKLYIEGQLETRKWTDSEGKEQYSTEVVLRPYRGDLTILDSKGGSEGGSSSGFGDSNRSDNSFGGASSSNNALGGSSAGNYAADLDDDIPF